MSKEEMERMERASDKSLTVALNAEAGEYYLYFKGDGNLSFDETMTMWKHLTNWIVDRARDFGEETYEDLSFATHTVRAMAKKVIDLGKEEAIRVDGLAETLGLERKENEDG